MSFLCRAGFRGVAFTFSLRGVQGLELDLLVSEGWPDMTDRLSRKWELIERPFGNMILGCYRSRRKVWRRLFSMR